MSAFNSSLPIRTEQAGDVIVKIADATIESQQLKVNADGSIDVNASLATTDIDIRDLAFATDKVDVSGSEVSLDAATLAALENITVSATDLDIRNLNSASDSVAAVQSGSWTVTATATDLDVRDLAFDTDKVDVSGSFVAITSGDGADFLAINTDGSINVRISDESPDTGAVVFNTVASVASGATSTHTYTSTGNFHLQQVEASASGKMKIVVKVNAVTRFVGFSSTANPNISLILKQPVLATTGQTVTVERTNLDNQAQDLYSTVIGYIH